MSMDGQRPDVVEQYAARFDRIRESVSSGEADSVLSLRREAMGRFTELGFPTTRLEEWKDTDVSTITKSILPPSDHTETQLKESELIPLTLEDTHRVVIVNGGFRPDFSMPGGGLREVAVRSLAEIIRNEAELLKPFFGQIADFYNHPFVALNTAFVDDGVVIRIPEGKVIAKPIHLLHIFNPVESDTIFHTRNLIVAGANSQATVVEHYVGFAENAYTVNAVTEISVGENAVLHHIKIQQDSPSAHHISMTQAQQGGNSQIVTTTISAGSRLTRNDIVAVLAGEGADCVMNGLILAKDDQHIDNHTILDHAKPHCTSREFFKGIHHQKSHGVFSGRIIVRKDAQKTNAEQKNKNLLLSDSALVNSNPQLEIYADDVRCTHGSTTGQIDEEALFYLRSRGLDTFAAQILLINGFANEIVDGIQAPSVRTYVQALLESWLREARLEGMAS